MDDLGAHPYFWKHPYRMILTSFKVPVSTKSDQYIGLVDVDGGLPYCNRNPREN